MVRIWRLSPLSGRDDGQDALRVSGGSAGQASITRPCDNAAAPPPDAGGRSSDLAGCTPGLGWGDWGATPTADGKLRNNS